MPITITKVEPKTSKNGNTYKAVELSTGMKATMWPTTGSAANKVATPGWDDIRDGAVGDVEITTDDKGGKQYHNIVSFTPTAPGAPSTNAALPNTHNAAPDWEGKDRSIAAQAAFKAAAELTRSLVDAKIVKDFDEARTAAEAFATSFYGLAMQARAGTLVYEGFDPFADE